MRETVDRDPQTVNKKGRVGITGDTYVRQRCRILKNKTLLLGAAGRRKHSLTKTAPGIRRLTFLNSTPFETRERVLLRSGSSGPNEKNSLIHPKFLPIPEGHESP